MDMIIILGFAAGALASSATLPQIVRTRKLKETKDISLWVYLISFVAILLWLIYGSFIKDLPLIISNSIAIIFVSIMIFFKLKYG